MDKETYENYSGMLYCKSCKRYVPKEHMYYKKVYPDGSVTRCNVCEWIKRHPDKLSFDGFSEEEILNFLHIMFYDKYEYIDNFADVMGRSLDQIIKLHYFLNVKNKHVNIKTICDNCGKEFGCTLSDYNHTEHHYCSSECYYEHKKHTSKKGKDSQFYNRIETSCTNCSKKIFVIPYNYNTKNKYGDNHNFCCNKCYWEYRSKYYIGDKSVMKNYKFSQKQRDRQRIQCLKNIKNMKSKDTSIQLAVNNILDDLNIFYEREYAIKYYSLDNFLCDYNLGIEVMGDYWHVNPNVYNINNRSVNDTQYKDITKDKKKRTYLRRYYNMELLNLWECDIKKNIEMCKLLIIYYISNNGIIENYNSFNWTINKNGALVLKDNVIHSYFEMDKKYAKQILKNVS